MARTFRLTLVILPGRVCNICDAAQELTREEFYAEFGERYQTLLH